MNELYPEGFVTPVESEDFEPGLTRDTVLKLSAMKDEPEWLTEFRLKAFDHLQTIKEYEDISSGTFAKISAMAW